MSILYSLWKSRLGCNAQSARHSGPQPGSAPSQQEGPEPTGRLVPLELLSSGCPQLSKELLRGWRRGADKAKGVRRACQVIQTLVPGRRDPGKFLSQCFSLSGSSGQGGGDRDCLSPMWGPAPPGGLPPAAWRGGVGLAGAGVAAVGCTEACQGGMINEQPHQLRLTFGEPSRTSAELSAL